MELLYFIISQQKYPTKLYCTRVESFTVGYKEDYVMIEEQSGFSSNMNTYIV